MGHDGGMFNPSENALVVVDVQNDFVEGGSLAVAGGQAVADNLAQWVVPSVQQSGIEVFYTKDWHINPGTHFSDEPDYVDSWPRHCVAETQGAEFAADFPPVGGDRLFKKGQFEASYSGAEGKDAYGQGLVESMTRLRIRNVTVVGIAYDYCVAATAEDLAKAGFNVYVVKPLTASVHPDQDNQTTARLLHAGINVIGFAQ